MLLFLITGIPGTGKSTVNAELKARGFESYDGDQDKLAHWYNIATGQEVSKADELRTTEFGQTHSRDIPRSAVEHLRAKAGNKPVFLCGDPENEDKLRDLFDRIFALTIDEPTRRHRLVARKSNSWGKLPHEVERDMLFKKKAEATYKRPEYTVLDSSQSPAALVDQILAKLGLS